MVVEDKEKAKVTRTVCLLPCAEACGMMAYVKDGVLTKLEPADFPEPGHVYVCRKGICAHKIVHHPDRLKYPLKRIGERGEGKWQRISWDEALDTIASKLSDISAKYGPESLGIMCGGLSLPNGGVFLGQRFASVLGATWIIPQAAALAAQQCADLPSYGTRWSIPYHEDHENPRLIVFWGSNSVATFPWKYRRRTRLAREKGAKMVSISPLFHETAAKADEWIPIRPGTDAALALGMINVIIGEGLCDETFLIKRTAAPFLVRSDNGFFLREEQASSSDSPGKRFIWDTRINSYQTFDTEGTEPALRGSYQVNGVECKPAFQLLAELAEQYPLDKASEITDVSPEAISQLAIDYATLKPVVTDRGIGLSRTFNGDLTYRAINILAAVTGNICLKRPEADPFSILNWMPFFFPEGRMYKTTSTFEFYENHRTGKPYPIKAFWVSSHNPANSHPNRNNFLELMRSMELIVVVDIFMTATAEYADIVLPGCTNAECTNMALPWTALWGGGHPYFQMLPKLIEPIYETKSDLEILTELAKRLGIGEFFDKSAEEYLEMILSSGHASLEGVTLEKLREGPVKPKPWSIPFFYTPSNRIEFYDENLKRFGQELPVYMEPPESVSQPLAQKYPLCLIHTHCKGRFHSMGENVDWLKELDPEPVVNMNPVDADKRGIQDGDRVMAFNDRGKVKLKARLHEGIRPGTISINEGWQPKHFAEGHFQELTGTIDNPAQQAAFQPVGQINHVLVEVKRS